ncbi:hypothetical protein E4T66_18835 [Sinimarinibacterium sp. CAU 1509]|uniref:BPSS1780 family membrane protein n=1 Tax=Sinimarinibacterium sp. CAU 1509 TaxID=2562283 RepID=UPI0010AB9117|nr:BPSS1780 family membrane protein [Sinimarinibacterium sp. CAU 1509]TJY56622.1 hypothetical protein E4T66_18835 [Sinimarinibacterium sp. CAU 1509]
MQPQQPIHTAPAGAGWRWITDAFRLFRADAGAWIAAMIVVFVVTIVVSSLPLLGSLLINLFAPVLFGGIALGAQAQDRGERFKLEYLWAGMQSPHLQPLLLLGVAYVVMGAIIVVVAMVLVFGSAVSVSALSGDHADVAAASGVLLGALVVLLMSALMGMATWFAPTLVVLSSMDPVAALQTSFAACLRNVIPLLVYGIALLALLILAMIPLGLGLLVLAPVMLLSVFTAYKDIFVPASAAPRRPVIS